MTSNALKSERGFTLMELLVASVVTIIVLGGAVALTSQIQNGYRRQLEDSVGEQEARYALEWIGRYLRSVGNNPHNAASSTCPAAGTDFYGLIPAGTSQLTIQSDSNPPDGLIGGASPNCTQQHEHVTISHTGNEIQFLDQAVGTVATTRTDAVIQSLQFVYLNDSGTAFTPDTTPPITPGLGPANIYYVRTTITIRTRTGNASAGLSTRTLTSQIRVRGR